MVYLDFWFWYSVLVNYNGYSPNRITRNQIDHVLINKRFRNSVEDTRVYRSANIGNENTLKTFSIALKNRYQVLEDEGLKIEEDEEI